MITPLTVRLDGAEGSLMITRSVADLSFKSISPGGFGSVQVTLRRPLAKDQIAPFSMLTIFDGMTGEIVGGGRILDPGRSNGDNGEVAQITCLGEGLASMQDRTEPYFLIDSGLDQWVYTSRTTRRMSESRQPYENAPNDDDSLVLATTEDKDIDPGDSLVLTHKVADKCDQNIGGFGFRHKSGFANTNWRVRGRVLTSGLGTADVVVDDAWDTPMSSRMVTKVISDWTNPRPVASVSWNRLNTTITATKSQWSAVNQPIVRAQIYNSDGVLRTGTAYNNEYVLLSEAFTDVVARFCPRLDLANANIATTSHHFDQLMWLSGINPMGVLAEMLEVEAAYAWHVWEKGPNGYRTELVAKPSEVRYEATARDGFSSPAPNTEVYNVVYVTWTSPGGKDQVTRVPSSGTSPVPSLDAEGIVRSTTIALGTEKGSTANATKAGTDFLADHVVPPNSGTLTVSAGTRVYDRFTGRFVRPWHIRPNELIRVRGVQPTPDTLNATSPDGVTVFRIVSNEYSDSSAASSLELDDFELTEARAIAKLARARRVS